MQLHEFAQIRVSTEVFIIYKDEVLLQRRSLQSKVYPGVWSIPGGHVDAGEDALKSAIREVYEETGITIEAKNINLKVQSLNHHIDKGLVWAASAFVAEIDNKDATKSSDEGEIEWFKISNLAQIELFPPIRLMIDFALSNKDQIMFLSSEWNNNELVEVKSKSYIII